ncbi:POK6 protein, partial [Poecile atricapillus]|nr:POK6 protein [Poecile atricapillus]
MGTLQPGIPSPVMLPQKWPLLIVDLKGCFFTTPLHLEDTKRFFETACMAHKQFHQNAKGLMQFSLSISKAQGIVQACP